MTTAGNTVQITTNESPSVVVDTPMFPGAYISNHGATRWYGHSIPIYHSIPSISDNYMTTTAYGSNNSTGLEYILANKDKYIIVNPRYKLEVYQVPDYGYHKSGTQSSGYDTDNINFYTADNTNGTELLLHKVPTSDPENIDLEIESCKLFYKDDDDIVREVIPLKHSQITSSLGSIFNISTYHNPFDSNISFETVNLTYNGQTYKLAKFYYGGKITNTGKDITVPCLLVGGGGSCGYASGTSYGSGGGGAGGYGEGTITLKRNVTYDISVGPGGVSTASGGPGGNPGVDTYIRGSDGSECRVYGGGAGCKSFPNNNMGNNSNDGTKSGSSGGGAFRTGTAQQDKYYSVTPTGGQTTFTNTRVSIYMSYFANKGGGGNEGGGSGGGAGGAGLTGSEGTTSSGVRGGNGKQWIDGLWYAVGGSGGQYVNSGSQSGNSNYVRELGRGVGGAGRKGSQGHTTSGSCGICILAIPI